MRMTHIVIRKMDGVHVKSAILVSYVTEVALRPILDFLPKTINIYHLLVLWPWQILPELAFINPLRPTIIL